MAVGLSGVVGHYVLFRAAAVYKQGQDYVLTLSQRTVDEPVLD